MLPMNESDSFQPSLEPTALRTIMQSQRPNLLRNAQDSVAPHEPHQVRRPPAVARSMSGIRRLRSDGKFVLIQHIEAVDRRFLLPPST